MIISGYSIVFNVESVTMFDGELFREIIAPEAVSKEMLDASDIVMTMFHNRETILARSQYGKGSLSYAIDGMGVQFRFDTPDTSEGDKAVELVKRGDLTGCSFAFIPDFHSIEREEKDGYVLRTIHKIKTVRDFTIAATPAYPQTSVMLGNGGFGWHREAAQLRNRADRILNNRMIW